MSTLAQLAEQTAYEPPPNPIVKPDHLDLVADDMRSRVGRTLVAQKTSQAFVESQNAGAPSSFSVTESEASAVRAKINGAISGAFPSVRIPSALSLQPLQEWEGYVAEIGDDVFTARLLDVTARNKYEEEVADFPIADLSDTDRELLKPGAIFRWVIGYQRQRGGTKRRVSQITFRRMPAWSKKDIVDANRKAEGIAKSINWS